jgi:hypothetical protein
MSTRKIYLFGATSVGTEAYESLSPPYFARNWALLPLP